MIPDMSPAEAAAQLAADPELILLDCREPEELAIASLPGALAIPMGDIPSRLPELDPDASYIIVCHHGQRSAMVAAFLLSQDFASVTNLRGGIDAWSRDLDPTIPRY